MRPLRTITPAVTCSVQSTFTTGTLPREHGIVANGWYFRDLAEVWLWRQSNHLVAGEKIWDAAARRDPRFTCAKLFWWYNMYRRGDVSVTPRPMYPADGRKLPTSTPSPRELRDELHASGSGTFPLFNFWGPGADIVSSRWIADCALHVCDTRQPTLTLVYLPHLDYDLQRLGPTHPAHRRELRAIDALCGELIDHAAARRRARDRALGVRHHRGARRRARQPRAARGRAARACATSAAASCSTPARRRRSRVADHQVAHVYVQDRERVAEVKRLLEACRAWRRCSTRPARAGRARSPPQ